MKSWMVGSGRDSTGVDSDVAVLFLMYRTGLTKVDDEVVEKFLLQAILTRSRNT